MTCCRFSSLKTLLTSMESNPSIVLNVLPDIYWPVFSCPSLAGFGCPPKEGHESTRNVEIAAHSRWGIWTTAQAAKISVTGAERTDRNGDVIATGPELIV